MGPSGALSTGPRLTATPSAKCSSRKPATAAQITSIPHPCQHANVVTMQHACQHANVVTTQFVWKLQFLPCYRYYLMHANVVSVLFVLSVYLSKRNTRLRCLLKLNNSITHAKILFSKGNVR